MNDLMICRLLLLSGFLFFLFGDKLPLIGSKLKMKEDSINFKIYKYGGIFIFGVSCMVFSIWFLLFDFYSGVIVFLGGIFVCYYQIYFWYGSMKMKR